MAVLQEFGARSKTESKQTQPKKLDQVRSKPDLIRVKPDLDRSDRPDNRFNRLNKPESSLSPRSLDQGGRKFQSIDKRAYKLD